MSKVKRTEIKEEEEIVETPLEPVVSKKVSKKKKTTKRVAENDHNTADKELVKKEKEETDAKYKKCGKGLIDYSKYKKSLGMSRMEFDCPSDDGSSDEYD